MTKVDDEECSGSTDDGRRREVASQAALCALRMDALEFYNKVCVYMR